MTFSRIARLPIVAAVAVLVAVGAGAQSRRPMTVDDAIDLVQLSAPRLSPDGQRVLFTVSELAKWKENKRTTSVWMSDVATGDARKFLGHERDKNAAWSPDGRLIAFLASRDAKEESSRSDTPPQIWIIRTDGGEATRLTDHKGTIKSFEWTDDGSTIVFAAEPAKSESEKADEKAGDDVIFVDEAANGQERGEFSGLWRIGIASKAEQAITHDARLLIEDFQVSSDATKVAVIYRRDNTRNGQFRAEVAVVDAATGTLTDLTHNSAPEQNVRWSPDGKLLSYLAPSDTSWELAEQKIWIVPAAGGAPKRLLNGFAGSLRQYAWARDSQSIVFGATTRGRGAAFRVAVPSGTVTRLAGGEWAGAMESVSADGRLGAAIVSSPGTAAEVHVIDLQGGSTRPVTHLNSVATQTVAVSQFRPVTWKSRDGLDIEGLLWLPADYKGGRLPLLLSVHGGPAGVWDLSFRAINHVYTGLGWAVLEPNVRGSSSYGDALIRGNMKDIGGGDYFDLMTGVDKLIADGIADADHMAIRGWSYGGILGGWTITQTTRFKAASLGAMVSDWSSEYAMGFNHDVRLWYIGGTPWESGERYRQQSSYSHIASVTTPTLLLHGERDTTDTIGQSMIYYQGLKDRDVPVRFIRFPREPHGFREPHHVRIRDGEEISWLMKYARGIDWKMPERKDAEPPVPKKSTDQ